MEPPLGQIECMVEEHQREIKRRREGYEEHLRHREEGCEPTGFAGGGAPSNEPFQDPSQAFVVFNLSHTHIPPRTADGGDPGLRLCGAFGSQEEALHHARSLAAADPDCSVLLAPTHEWAVMASTPEMLADAEGVARFKAERLEAYQRELAQRREEFERRRAQEEEPVALEAAPPEAKQEPPQQEEAPEPPNQAPTDERREYLAPYRRDAELREQAVAVVSFLPDVAGRSPAHTLFCVWRVFGTEAEAEDWIVNVAGHRVRDFSFDTVSLYEWLKPQTVDTADIRKVTYRNKEQSNIMAFASNQQAAIDSFKQECAQKGHETPYIEL